jgi:hypothetical protein
MLWGNYDGFSIQGTNTILEGLRSNPSLTAHFTEGCDHLNTTIVWIDLWENITTVFDWQTVAWLNGSFYPNVNLSCAPSVTTVIPRPRRRDDGESSLRCGSFLYSNYSVRFVSSCTMRQTAVLKMKYSLRLGLWQSLNAAIIRLSHQAPQGCRLALAPQRTLCHTKGICSW